MLPCSVYASAIGPNYGLKGTRDQTYRFYIESNKQGILKGDVSMYH
jgi:hypothetical protein